MAGTAEQPLFGAPRDDFVDRLGVRARPRLLGQPPTQLLLGARERFDEAKRAFAQPLPDDARVLARALPVGQAASRASATRSRVTSKCDAFQTTLPSRMTIAWGDS